MKLKLLLIVLLVFNLNYSQGIEYQILNANLDQNNKIILKLLFINRTNVNYVINNNFVLENKVPDFSSGSYTKVNIFKNSLFLITYT